MDHFGHLSYDIQRNSYFISKFSKICLCLNIVNPKCRLSTPLLQGIRNLKSLDSSITVNNILVHLCIQTINLHHLYGSYSLVIYQGTKFQRNLKSGFIKKKSEHRLDIVIFFVTFLLRLCHMNLNDNFFNQSCDPITAVINARYEWPKKNNISINIHK